MLDILSIRCYNFIMAIYDYLQNYKADRYHTPGHKGLLASTDITELEDMFPLDIVAKAESDTAKIYGTPNLRYLVGGSSAGIKAGILAARGDVVCEHYRHCAVDEGVTLSQKSMHIISLTAEIGEDGMYKLPTPESLAQVFEQTGATIAVLQYPDYYGRCMDIEGMRKVCDDMGRLLYVDSAHGAHFVFNEKVLPQSGVPYGDGCNLSAHKTLNAYTQTAYLTFGEKFAELGIEDMLRCLSTTSPNYVFYAQLEQAGKDGKANAGEYERLRAFRDRLACSVSLLKNDDCTKIAVDCTAGNARDVYRQLVRRDIVAEKCDERYVLFITTPADDENKLARLEKALIDILNRS